MRDVDDEAAGERDLGRQACALRLHRVLDGLDEDRLAALDQVLDLAGAPAALELGADDLVDVEEAVLLEADLDERGLHARQDVVDGAEIDVAGDRAVLRPLEVDLGDDLVLEHGDALLARIDGDEQLALRLRQGRAARCGAARSPRPRLARLALGLLLLALLAVAGRPRLPGRGATRPLGGGASRPLGGGASRPLGGGATRLSSAGSATAVAAPVAGFFLRPRPPRLPRRRFFGVLGCPSAAGAGSASTGVSSAGSVGTAAACGACSSSALWRRNQGSGKENLLRNGCAQPRLERARVSDER